MNTQTLEQHVIKTTHTHAGETFNTSFDVTEFVPLLKELNERFEKVQKRAIDKTEYKDGKYVVVGKEEFPKYDLKYEKDSWGFRRRTNINEIDNISKILNNICQEVFTVDFFDSGACVIGMQVELEVLPTSKRKTENVCIVSQYGQGEGFNYVYHKRVLQLIEKYIPSMFPYVKTNCGRMD